MSQNPHRRLKIVAGADPFGCALKDTLVSHLNSLHIDVHDLGTDNYYSVGEKIGRIVSTAAADNATTETRGLIACATGVGVSIFANKFPGVYAATCLTPSDAVNARSINNCNVIAFSGVATCPDSAIETLNMFLNTPFKSPCPASNSEPWPENIQTFLQGSISVMSKIGTTPPPSLTSCSICNVAGAREFSPVGNMPGGSMKIVRDSPTCAVVKFRGGSIEPGHHHTHGHDVVVLKGRKVVWNLTKSERFELGVGDYLYTPAEDVHRVKYLEDTEFFIRWDGGWDVVLDEDLATAASDLEKEPITATTNSQKKL